MRQTGACIALLVLILPAVASGWSPDPIKTKIDTFEKNLLPPVRVENDPAYTLVDRMAHYRIPGLSIAVIHNHRIEWAKGYGLIEKNSWDRVGTRTLFQAASISKPVAAMVALKMVETGRLGLQTDVTTLPTRWKLPHHLLMEQGKVTLERILSHSAGLTVHGFPGYRRDAPLPSLVQILDGSPPANTAAVRVDIVPGSRFRYSGGGITLMQYLLEETEGKSFDHIAKTTVLAPLHMDDSTYRQPPPKSLQERIASGHHQDGRVIEGKFHIYPEQAAAGLWTTPRDLAKFAIEIQQSLLGRSDRVLSQAMVRRMLTPVGNAGNGLGLFISREHPGYFEHGGANEGFRCRLIAHMNGGYGAVVMVNSDNGDIIPEILRGLAAVYDWKDYLPPPHRILPLSDAMRKRLPGRYHEDADHILEVSLKDDRLFLRRTYGDPVEIHPVAGGRFIRRDLNLVYEPTPPEQDRPPSLVVTGGGRRVSCPRVPPDTMVPGEYLLAGDLPAAREAYRRLHDENPADGLVSLARLSAIFDHFSSRKLVRPLLTILELTAEWYPQLVQQYRGPIQKEIYALLRGEGISPQDRALLKRESARILAPPTQTEAKKEDENP